MRTITFYLLVLIISFVTKNLTAQEEKYKEKVEVLQNLKNQITNQERDALKIEVEAIDEQLKEGEITEAEAKTLKGTAAKKRALNIENRIVIIDNKISLLERNKGVLLELEDNREDIGSDKFTIDINGERVFSFDEKKRKKKIKYDHRTYTAFVMAIGLNNSLIDGQSLEDSPYKIGGSRFFEIGWAWRTRLLKNSNFLRLNYGLSFQFNGLKPKNNQYFVVNNGQAELQEFEFDLKKSKLRMDNLVFPVHFEFGPSKFRESENKIRYSLRNQFRLGIGGYGGFNLGTRQKLKYNRAGERVKDKLKRGYNTSNFIYGLSAYIGFDTVLLYAKYDLNPIFKDAVVEQHNISLGLRFDLW
ncbi:FIG00653053: hypothetical protein [hydrothermal vent metagenome]|uniref:Outer membrane protein beta-barrel domain-containing protein n=1 Tax=hydrothermal vent metagenome TaxID=652676 RepID=A0A3B0SVU4_9ZZZZ